MVNVGKNPFSFDICGTKFLRKLDLEGHIASVREGKKTFRCETCDAKFLYKHQLTRNINLVHQV